VPELTGGLIRMNAHMVVRGDAKAMIIFGIIFAAFCLVCAVATLLSKKKEHKKRYVAFFVSFALIGVIVAVIGSDQPRQKVIMACADGPISLEQVAAVYEIKGIDGKMLTLVER